MSPDDIESRLRALESRDDDREALRRRLESALSRADALERELAALREQHAKTEALYDEQMAMRLRAEEILGATNWENTDHAAERVMKELAALRASPSPSAGAVPEVKVVSIPTGYKAVMVGEHYVFVDYSDGSRYVEQTANDIRLVLFKYWPKPHADAGGEARPKAYDCDGCDSAALHHYCIRCLDAKTDASAEAARRDEREAILTIVRELPFNDRAAMTWGDIVRRIEKRVDARVAEREKTETSATVAAEEKEHGLLEHLDSRNGRSPQPGGLPEGRQQDGGGVRGEAEGGRALDLGGDDHVRRRGGPAQPRGVPRERNVEAEGVTSAPLADRATSAGTPQEPGATPAPCPRCKGSGEDDSIPASVSIAVVACPSCSGTGRVRSTARDLVTDARERAASLGFGRPPEVPCPACSGTGRAPASSPRTCTTCGGKGGCPCGDHEDHEPDADYCPECGRTRAPASSPAPAAPEVELDSPPFVPQQAKDLAARGFERVNRNAAPEARGEAPPVDPLWTALQSARADGPSEKGTFVGFGYEALTKAVREYVAAERARARDAALEEAAAACEAVAGMYGFGRGEAAEVAMRRIRSLRGKAESGEGGT